LVSSIVPDKMGNWNHPSNPFSEASLPTVDEVKELYDIASVAKHFNLSEEEVIRYLFIEVDRSSDHDIQRLRDGDTSKLNRNPNPLSESSLYMRILERQRAKGALFDEMEFAIFFSIVVPRRYSRHVRDAQEVSEVSAR
jgi:hypothetical protein